MTPACPAPPQQSWLAYFRANAAEPPLPWDDGYRLSGAERVAVVPSIQQFEMGENAGGTRLMRRAEEFARRRGDQEFADIMRLFIGEEQRHSRMLRRFLETQRAPCLERHWVHGAFRWVRGLAGLELFLRVLATAEVMAMPYYSALARATSSPLLREICRRILREEAQHLRYQASNFALLGSGRTRWINRLVNCVHRGFLAGTALLVWFEHGAVLKAGGYSPARFWRKTYAQYRVLEGEMADAQSAATSPGAASISANAS